MKFAAFSAKATHVAVLKFDNFYDVIQNFPNDKVKS